MNTLRTNKQGFTMVELLVVLVIIGILAAVATPIFLGNTQKAKASEAVATMSLIRQAQRDYFINNNSFVVPIGPGEIGLTPENKGVAVNTGVAQYFANDAFEVKVASAATANLFKKDDGGPSQALDAQDFVIRVDGSKSIDCSSGAGASKNCALKKAEVKDFRLEMDNTGRAYVSYDAGANWQKY
ncbi:MAG: type IV pilin protein [Candidatus Omnitrophota bacterium]